MFYTIWGNLRLTKPDFSNASPGVILLASEINVCCDLLTVPSSDRVGFITTTMLFLVLECVCVCGHIHVCMYLCFI